MSFRDAGRVERFRESRNPARGGPSSLSSHCPSAPRSDIPSRQERVSGPDSPSPVFCLVGQFSQVTFLSQISQIRCGGNGAEHLCPNRHDTHLTRVLSQSRFLPIPVAGDILQEANFLKVGNIWSSSPFLCQAPVEGKKAPSALNLCFLLDNYGFKNFLQNIPSMRKAW